MEILRLTKKQEETLKSFGQVRVTHKGIDLILNEDGSYQVADFNGAIINPEDVGSKRLVLTIAQGKEILKTGSTTHTKDGVTYDIVMHENEEGYYYVATPRLTSVVTHAITSNSIIELK